MFPFRSSKHSSDAPPFQRFLIILFVRVCLFPRAVGTIHLRSCTAVSLVMLLTGDVWFPIMSQLGRWLRTHRIQPLGQVRSAPRSYRLWLVLGRLLLSTRRARL